MKKLYYFHDYFAIFELSGNGAMIHFSSGLYEVFEKKQYAISYFANRKYLPFNPYKEEEMPQKITTAEIFIYALIAMIIFLTLLSIVALIYNLNFLFTK